jgi:hypothetical protein
MINMVVNVLMFGDLSSTFIKKDYNLLKDNFNLTYLNLKRPKRRSLKYIFWFIINLFKLYSNMKSTDYLFSKWCDSYFVSFLGFIYHKKVILVAGGYDTVKDRVLKYGVFTNKISTILTTWCVKNDYKVFVYNDYLKKNLIKNTNLSCGNVVIVPAGYDKKFWVAGNHTRLFHLCVVINVIDSRTKTRHFVKGIDRFLKIAIANPNNKFVLIGCEEKVLRYLNCQIPSNLKMLGFVNKQTLLYYYQRAIC